MTKYRSPIFQNNSWLSFPGGVSTRNCYVAIFSNNMLVRAPLEKAEDYVIVYDKGVIRDSTNHVIPF